MKFLILSLTLTATNLYGLGAEQIQKLADEPHSRENLVEELKLYPNAREYKITVRTGASIDKLEAMPEVPATEKTVQGKFIVSQVNFPNTKNPMILVVSYDKKGDVFKKWVLLPDGIVAGSTGVPNFKTRTIAWTSNKAHGEPPSTVLSIETHSDKKSLWKETTLHEGKVTYIIRGVAVKTK